MSVSLLTEAIIDRLKTDTAAGGIYATGAWNTALCTGVYFGVGSPGTQAFPYAVLNVEAAHDDAFAADILRATVTLDLYDSSDKGLARMQAAWHRVYGDAVKQAGRVPSFGLHRHLLVLDTDSTKNPLAWEAGQVTAGNHAISSPTENVVSMTTTFEVHIQATAGNP